MNYTSPQMPPTPEDYAYAFPEPERTHTPAKDANCEHDDDSHTSLGLSRVSGGSKVVAPFLARHIADQYAPQGGAEGNDNARNDKPNTKFCYRHRPDLKCRRTVDESRMEGLQKVIAHYRNSCRLSANHHRL